MPAPYGLTSTGFSRKVLAEIKEELEAELLEQISPKLNLSASGILGQIVGIFAAKIEQVWDLAAAVHTSQYPDGATGFSLSILSALTGTNREAATRSTVTATVNLDAATTLPAGSVASVDGNPAVRFRTIADVTSVLADDYEVEMEAEETGPVIANGGTLTVIQTPVVGWNSVTNALDAEVGADDETDAALRLRREAELRAQGTSPVDAIRSDLLEVEDVTQAQVFENTSHVANSDGMPPHSIEAVVVDGDDQDIADAIWAAKAGGIAAHGTTTVEVLDSAGGTHDVKFTRPTEVTVHVEVTVLTDADEFPADGEDQIKAAIKALGDQSQIGEDVIRGKFFAPVFSVTGVLDVTTLELDDVDPPVTTANLTIGARSIAVFEVANIDVTVTT